MKSIQQTLQIFLLLILMMSETIRAQELNCALRPPVVNIDFGSGNIPDVNSYVSKYERDFSHCPNDGFYSFTSNTDNCFNGDWLTINQDHSSNRENGNMMLVNASITGGIFFNTNLNGFKDNTSYQFNVWLMNVCKINGGCAPLPPNITISITTANGTKIGIFKTGLLTQADVPHWRKFTGFFQTPLGVTSLTLTMADNTLGGCGNDFAMDDITISECVTTKPEIKKELPLVLKEPVKQQPAVIKQTPVAKPSIIKKNPAIIKQVKKDTTVSMPIPVKEKKLVVTMPVTKISPVIKLPDVITARANPIVKQIETGAGKILIELYDNGEIDGDTVTVYDNNQMIISRAGLSDKPISFDFMVDKMQPHHEIVMVANNLGSIPPNTSMMIITANNKRYEVFISSSEQKNAKVVFDLKE